MSDQNNQMMGDGQDNYAGAAKNTMNAAKQMGQAATQTAATAGTEAVTNAAAASVQASVQGGTAVAEIAAGTAAGGPYGAAIMAVWSMRHTLFKVLIFIIVFILFCVSVVVSLPSVIMNNLLHTDPDTVDPNAPTTIQQNYDAMAEIVSDCVSAGYDYALSEVERIISVGGYDYDTSMEALINNGHASADYDTCYVLAAYSASMGQKGTGKTDLKDKMTAVRDKMFAVTYTEKTATISVPSMKEGEPATSKTVKYAECTIHPFDTAVINQSFNIDGSATYDQFGITYSEAIKNMSNALKMTLYGSIVTGNVPPITDTELNAYITGLTCSSTRRELMRVALSLVGKVPYFWGGKSAPGWNDEWNTPKLVSIAGSSSSGTIRPYGLDCSGYTTWVYNTALGKYIGDGTSGQWSNSTAITEAELLPGDLGFLNGPEATGASNHVLIFAGRDAGGNKLWVHCSSGLGVAMNSPDYVKYYRRIKNCDLETEMLTPPVSLGNPILIIQADVTHYCACSKCNGPGSNGMTASGKRLMKGMVAMSSHYPFGTQIMINGVLYTVEDRGGSGIENDNSRVDIFVLDHQEALRFGRFKTEAKIYRVTSKTKEHK